MWAGRCLTQSHLGTSLPSQRWRARGRRVLEAEGESEGAGGAGRGARARPAAQAPALLGLSLPGLCHQDFRAFSPPSLPSTPNQSFSVKARTAHCHPEAPGAQPDLQGWGLSEVIREPREPALFSGIRLAVGNWKTSRQIPVFSPRSPPHLLP